MFKKILSAVGILWITCSFFLYGGVQNDFFPADKPQITPVSFSSAGEKALQAEEEFIRLFSRLPDRLVRKKQDWELFFSLLEKSPSSIFLNGLLVQSYRQLPGIKEKKAVAEKLGNLSRKYPGNWILAAMASDILAETDSAAASGLLLFHLDHLEKLSREKQKKYTGKNAPSREFLLYMVRSRARFQLKGAPAEERSNELKKHLELFPGDLTLLQFLLRSEYEVFEKTKEEKPFLPFLDSRKERMQKKFFQACREYLENCRKVLKEGKSLHLAKFHPSGLFYLEKSPWKEEKKNLLLEELMGKYPHWDHSEMLLLTSFYEKEKANIFTALALLRLLREENFPADTFHFLLAEKNLKDLPSRKKRFELLHLAVLSNPENPETVFPLIQALWEDGKEKEAWEILQQLYPSPHAYMFAAQRMYALGNWERASDFLRKAGNAFRHPKNGKAYSDQQLFHALTLDRSGKKMEAEKLLRELLSHQKDNHEAMNFLGYLLADENRSLPEAERLIRSALTREETQAYMDSLAWVCFRKKDYKNAVVFIEKAIALTPGGEEPDSLIYDHAGDIFHAAGNKKKALHFWKKAANCYSPEYDLAAILKKIRKVREGK